jgi:hypothetical protein
MSDNKILVAMKRPAGAVMDSELHLDGLIVKPDHATGIAWVPAEHVVALIGAGYLWAD